jgi:hypothetical protein
MDYPLLTLGCNYPTFTSSYSRRVKEEPTSPPPPSHSPETRRRPAPMLLSTAASKNIGLAILSPGLPPRATADPDSRKQLVEADAIRAQQQMIIDQRRNQSAKTSVPPVTPATGKRTPKTLSSNPRSTKRARAPPNITIDPTAGKNNIDLVIQSAPLYPPKGSLFNRTNGDSGPMTSSLYHSNKDGSTFPYSIPHRRGPSDPMPTSGLRPAEHAWSAARDPSRGNPHSAYRTSPPRLPSISQTFNSSHAPPTPPTPPHTSSRYSRTARQWIEGKSVRPKRRAHSDQEAYSSEESDTPITISLGDSVTMTKFEWLQRGQALLERAWHDMVVNEKKKAKEAQENNNSTGEQMAP